MPFTLALPCRLDGAQPDALSAHRPREWLIYVAIAIAHFGVLDIWLHLALQGRSTAGGNGAAMLN